jgi:pimeloyl-ACP methyl ester carboxylesterase
MPSLTFDPRCRNVFLDQRGYGASTKLPGGTRELTALYTADIVTLIDHLGLDRPMARRLRLGRTRRPACRRLTERAARRDWRRIT